MFVNKFVSKFIIPGLPIPKKLDEPAVLIGK